MNSRLLAFLWTLLLLLGVRSTHGSAPPSAFMNFETPTVHGMDLSPSGNLLAVCNLPDGRVELFNTANGSLRQIGSIRVGIDPVSVRFLNDDELWVVNHISQSINVIDVPIQRMAVLIPTSPRPTDVVFAGSPLKAFIAGSFANQIEVLDVETFQSITNIKVMGERPTALAVSPDGLKVFSTIKESGNKSTILARKLVALHTPSGPGPVEHKSGPYNGANPPPNSGNQFDPPINPALGTNAPPQVSLIVRQNAAGRWMDDNNKDWSEYISGTNAHLSGRIRGWGMLDHDLAIIGANDLRLGHADSLMTICLALGVNPKSGNVSVIGTEHFNHIRFEPRLKSVFAKVIGAVVDPESKTNHLFDLNPHLDYKSTRVPLAERQKSLGDPRAIVWHSNGLHAYVAGRGSDNVIVINQIGERTGDPIPVGEGPEALVLNEKAERLYVLNRFEGSISIISTATQKVVETIKLFDPTPAVIKKGRPHIYNTHATSGLGHLACATCHVDVRFDRLAWDLGDPAGQMRDIPRQQRENTSRLPPKVPPLAFHPMKGPMLTQSLQDIIGHEPLHWRGDRTGIEEFRTTFRDLQGTEDEFTLLEMKQIREFLKTVAYPPPPAFPLTSSVRPLPGFFSRGRGASVKGTPLPAGNLARGAQLAFDCSSCHLGVAGLGPLAGTTAAGITDTNGNQFLLSAIVERAEDKVFKVPGFRNLLERTGFNLESTNSTAGFGYLHDGRVDTLERFLQEGTDTRSGPLFTSDRDLADVLAFILSASSSRTPTSATASFPAPTLGADPLLGRQFGLTEANAETLFQALRANMESGTETELLLTFDDGADVVATFFDRANAVFKGGTRETPIAPASLPGFAALNPTFIFMVIPPQTQQRLAMDQDLDGFHDGIEARIGTSPADAEDFPFAFRIEMAPADPASVRLSAQITKAGTYRIQQSSTLDANARWTTLHETVAAPGPFEHRQTTSPEPETRYYRLMRIKPSL